MIVDIPVSRDSCEDSCACPVLVVVTSFALIMLCGCQAKMATRKPLHSSHNFDTESCEGGRELFEACRNGDVTKVRRIVNANSNVNLRDTAGRKSSPLHFAAGRTS